MSIYLLLVEGGREVHTACILSSSNSRRGRRGGGGGRGRRGGEGGGDAGLGLEEVIVELGLHVGVASGVY